MDSPIHPSGPKERELFIEAMDKTTSTERAAYLDAACGNDTALRRRIELLLERSAKVDTFLEKPVVSISTANQQAMNPAAEPGAATGLASATEQAGDRIGRYKLLEKIGEGGCGVVYLAEQEEPVRRRVALKVIKLGMDTKSVITRFEAERQALAMMDHPNIAKVLDAGATDAGRPFFVMELVRGVRITDYCDQNNLRTGERLTLFTQVCHAIQHAHQKGIIHRDIKPSNILVTLHDGVPVPKVIDFGIAKATTDQRLTDKTLFTALEQFIGTPAYMSPEQAEMSGLDIDTRSDIYSLGVLLYEMLTGKTPFDAKALLASGLDEMRRTIREQEPVRPSTRLSTMLDGELTTTARHRQSEALKLIHLLRGDVDWIVMKCLEKDRARRYETANGLASDIQRHLNNEAVLARPPSAAYRFQKLIRRNKLAFAAAASIATVLVLGVIVSTWQAVRATQAKGEAVVQRQSADKNAEKARQAEEKAESARTSADEATSLARKQAAEINRNLYFAEMNLAGNAASEPGGISRITDLTSKWLPEEGAADLRGWEWYYLRSLLHLDRFTLSGHTNEVSSVAWSPDGKRLASGSEDNTMKIWDTVSRQATLTRINHTAGVNSVAWSPDGKHLASGSSDRTIKIWDVANRRVAFTLIEHTAGVRSVAWSPDGKRLASGGEDRTIKIWDVASGTNILTLPGHAGGVASVAWSPDGKRLASGSYDATIKVWDAGSGQMIHDLPGHQFGVNSVSWSPDGKRLASGAADFMVKLWDAVEGTNITTLAGHFDNVRSVSWSPDGTSLASGCEDNTIKVWDAMSGRNTLTHRGHNKYVFSVAWSPDGKQLASGSEDGTIKIWDATSEETLTLRGHTNQIFFVAWSPDGKRVASASFDNTVKIWDPDSGQESRSLSRPTNEVNSVAWSPDGKRLASCGEDTIKVWDAGSGEMIHDLPGPTTSLQQSRVGMDKVWPKSVSWSPDGKRLASGNGEDNAINLYDATSWQVTRTLRGHTWFVYSVAWSPDGKFLASGSWDRTVRIWDAVQGTNIHKFPDEHSGGYTVVAWSPDGKQLAAGVFDKTVKVWDAVSGQVIHTLRGHSGGVLSVSWSPDGKRLASSSFDGTIKVWYAASGSEAVTLRGHTIIVQSVAWSPDGMRLASGSYDHTVKIWDARKGYALERK